MIQNRTITVNSGQPSNSKWWWIGDILKIRRWNPRNEITWRMTEAVSITYRPPRITRSSWVLVVIARAPKKPPSASEPVSPMKIRAGAAFHHRNPATLPIMRGATHQGVVSEEADDPDPHRGEHDRHARGRELAERDPGGDEAHHESDEDHDPAHRRRPHLLEMAVGTVLADPLTPPPNREGAD